MRIVVVGLGGIGSNLVEPLCRFIAHSQNLTRSVTLIDGKSYRDHNSSRQRTPFFSNKSEVSQKWLAELFPNLEIEAKPTFIDEDNIFGLLFEDDIIFLGCDNHATRKLISDYSVTLNNIVLISGGNELYDGNVQIYWKKDGRDITRPLTWQHPEIENPQDKNPSEMSCEELAQKGETQLLAVNMIVATLMLNAFTLYLLKGDIPYNEIYFDIATGNVRPVRNGKIIGEQV